MVTPWSCSAYSPAFDTLTIGAQDGSLLFTDWNSWRVSFESKTKPRRGTPVGEGGVNCMSYDLSGRILLTGEGDKTIKFWQVSN